MPMRCFTAARCWRSSRRRPSARSATLVLADLSQYATLSGGLQAAISADVPFLTDEVVFRFALRVDGKPLWASAITPFNGGSTRSPFVTLAAR